MFKNSKNFLNPREKGRSPGFSRRKSDGLVPFPHSAGPGAPYFPSFRRKNRPRQRVPDA